MAGTLWSHRDAYIENSPFFYLDRVHASVLLISGMADESKVVQAREAYHALRRLDKCVTWRSYRYEGHHTLKWSHANLRDLATSVVDWFDSELKGDIERR